MPNQGLLLVDEKTFYCVLSIHRTAATTAFDQRKGHRSKACLGASNEVLKEENNERRRRPSRKYVPTEIALPVIIGRFSRTGVGPHGTQPVTSAAAGYLRFYNLKALSVGGMLFPAKLSASETEAR